jgi:hypothetical protein
MRAWGVLGFAAGGFFIFSLLTLLLSGAVIVRTRALYRSFGGRISFSKYLL